MKKFTLIELIVVVAIIGILLSILLPSIQGARKKAQVAVCISNLHQTNTAHSMFLGDNNSKFIGRADIINIGGNGNTTGHYYLGTGGEDKATIRPLNIYLGVSEVGGTETMAVAICPLSSKDDQSLYRNRFETSYMGAGRSHHNNDLDGTNGRNPYSVAQIINPHQTVLAASTGAWHYSFYGANKWAVDNHGSRKYSFTLVDGSTKIYTIGVTEGLAGNRDRIQFTNE